MPVVGRRWRYGRRLRRRAMRDAEEAIPHGAGRRTTTTDTRSSAAEKTAATAARRDSVDRARPSVGREGRKRDAAHPRPKVPPLSVHSYASLRAPNSGLRRSPWSAPRPRGSLTQRDPSPPRHPTTSHRPPPPSHDPPTISPLLPDLAGALQLRTRTYAPPTHVRFNPYNNNNNNHHHHHRRRRSRRRRRVHVERRACLRDKLGYRSVCGRRYNLSRFRLCLRSQRPEVVSPRA